MFFVKVVSQRHACMQLACGCHKKRILMSNISRAAHLYRPLKAPSTLASINGFTLAAFRPFNTKTTRTTRTTRTLLGAKKEFSTFLFSNPNRLGAKRTDTISQVRSLFIQTEITPNVNSIKFKPGKPLSSTDSDSASSSKTYEFLSRRDAMQSPLATTLFGIEGVESIMFGYDFITITKTADSNWQIMKPDIYGAIMDFYSSNSVLFHQREKDTTIKEEDSEVVAMIKELLDTRIRPSIQDDGGDVEYIGFENGIVKLKLRGACRTCDSSSVTLKSGIERMLMHYVPEVEEVVQVLEEQEEISKKEFEKLERELSVKK